MLNFHYHSHPPNSSIHRLLGRDQAWGSRFTSIPIHDALGDIQHEQVHKIDRKKFQSARSESNEHDLFISDAYSGFVFVHPCRMCERPGPIDHRK